MKQQILLPGVCMPQDNTLTPAPQEEEPAYPDFVDGQSDADSWPSARDMLGSIIVFEPHRPTPPPIDVLGVDAGQDMTDAQRKCARRASVVAAELPVLERFFPHWNDGKGKKNGVEYVCLSPPHTEQALNRLSALHTACKSIVVVCEGDPLFLGLGPLLAARFDASHLRISPGLSVVQEVARRLALPWHTVHTLSLRGADSWQSLNTAVLQGRPLCVLTDADTTPDALARHLLDRGVEWFSLHIFEHLGAEDERHRACSLYEAAALTDCAGPAVLLLVPEGAPRRPALGLDHTAPAHAHSTAHARSTAPARALTLSLAQCQPAHTVWVVGAGDGLLALEAAALTYEGTVIAIERSAGRALGLRELRRRCGAAQLEVVHAPAPDCFDRLPRPERILLSGACLADNGDDVLLQACEYLRPAGRMVALCTSLSELNQCLSTLRSLHEYGWQLNLTSQQCAVTPPPTATGDAAFTAFAPDAPLTPLTPVYCITCQKPLN